MYEKITPENVVMFAIRHYNNPHCEGEKEFEDDLKRFKPTPSEEARWGLAVIEDSLWDTIPKVYRRLNNIFVNQGPGKFSGIRTSIAVAKALSITNKLNLYGFNFNDLQDMNYQNVVDLYEKGALTKNLINPVYSS